MLHQNHQHLGTGIDSEKFQIMLYDIRYSASPDQIGPLMKAVAYSIGIWAACENEKENGNKNKKLL